MFSGVAELPLIGGHPAVDLVNTMEPREPVPDAVPHDHLVDPAALLAWSRRAGVIEADEAGPVERAWSLDPVAAARALSAAREIREALYAAILAVLGVAPRDAPAGVSALEHLQMRWAAAMARSTLRLDAHGTEPVRLVVGSAPDQLLPDRLAAAAVDLLRTADPARLRSCPVDHGGCGWVFVDKSRNGSRRWCQMADCGTRVKARRLTERRRGTRRRYQ
jgi:predicted RNA-binding Zn ribbon-like protein